MRKLWNKTKYQIAFWASVIVGTYGAACIAFGGLYLLAACAGFLCGAGNLALRGIVDSLFFFPVGLIAWAGCSYVQNLIQYEERKAF